MFLRKSATRRCKRRRTLRNRYAADRTFVYKNGQQWNLFFWANGTGQPVRGFGFGVRDTLFRALGCTGWLCLFFGPSVESLPAYSVHVGDRSADPCQYCRPPIRQLQPAQCSTVSRKFRRAGSGIVDCHNRAATKDCPFSKRPTSPLRFTTWLFANSWAISNLDLIFVAIERDPETINRQKYSIVPARAKYVTPIR